MPGSKKHELMTDAEVCALLRISRPTLPKHLARGGDVRSLRPWRGDGMKNPLHKSLYLLQGSIASAYGCDLEYPIQVTEMLVRYHAQRQESVNDERHEDVKWDNHHINILERLYERPDDSDDAVRDQIKSLRSMLIDERIVKDADCIEHLTVCAMNLAGWQLVAHCNGDARTAQICKFAQQIVMILAVSAPSEDAQ